VILTNGNKKFVAENPEIISRIINISNGLIVTTGIKADFKVNTYEAVQYDSMLEKISNNFTVTGDLKNKDYYSIDFKEGGISGYLECIKDNNINNFSLCLEEESGKNNLDELAKMITKLTGKKNEDLKIDKYIKCKLENNNILKVNNELIEKIKVEGLKDIQTIKYNNGYSNVAFVQRGNNKETVNFVVCNYNSGSYLIVGTPEIFTEF
jgi:hypothetical protein